MPSWQGKSKASPLGYRIFVLVLKKFGVKPAYVLLRFVSFYYFLFSYKSSKTSFSFFYERIGFGKLRSLAKIYQNYYLFGQSLIDRIVVMAEIKNPFSFDFDGEEFLREMVANKKGGLLLSAHIGNWEIAGHLLKRLNTKINIVMFEGEHEKIKQYLESVTGERRVNVIVIKPGFSHIYEISDAFKNNELVCMHADRFMEGNKTVEQSFLNAPAKFPMGPFLLAAQFKVPVSFTFAMKETSSHYHFSATQPKKYDYPSKEMVMKEMLHDFVLSMEEKVKRYPEQWYNYYNFWE